MSHSPAIPYLTHLLRPLNPWLDDPGVEDVAINLPNEAWVYTSGEWDRRHVDMTHTTLRSVAILAGALRRQDVGPDNPLLDEKLPNGSRLCACLPPVALAGTVALSIRRHDRDTAQMNAIEGQYHTDKWNDWRVDEAPARGYARPLASYDAGDLGEFLHACIEGRLNIVFVGATGAGKTRFGKMVINAIDRRERLITIEDTDELDGSLPPNHVRLLYAKGHAKVGHEELLQAAMRMRPNRIIVGEMRDDAVITWIMEACTGHPGGITTIHGGDAREAVRRMRQLIKGSGRMAGIDVEEQLSDVIDVIIPIHEIRQPAFGKSRGIGAVWFAGDARRRGASLASDLF